jgi:putative copper resistance protein D
MQQFPVVVKVRTRFVAAGAFLAALLALSVPVALAHHPPEHPGHDGMDMSMPMSDQAQIDPAQQAIVLKDKKESEFNHHLAGFLVILAGVFLLCEGTLRQRWPQARFAWPSCFLLAGLFLLVFSDTELWPFGPYSWWYGLTQNLEDLQHKTFAAILLTLGILEIQRARGVLKSAWAAWVFPLLALCGSVLLLFHEHHSGMHGADHMTVMARIQAEHLNFAIAGCGIGVVKGLSELRTPWQTVFMKSWPLLLIVLGVLLLRYVE